jgi:hypothetical protein
VARGEGAREAKVGAARDGAVWRGVVGVEEDVARLQVAPNNIAAVKILNPIGDVA